MTTARGRADEGKVEREEGEGDEQVSAARVRVQSGNEERRTVSQLHVGRLEHLLEVLEHLHRPVGASPLDALARRRVDTALARDVQGRTCRGEDGLGEEGAGVLCVAGRDGAHRRGGVGVADEGKGEASRWLLLVGWS